MALTTYQTGAVSVSAGGAITVTGGIWSGPNVVAGDMASIDGGAALLLSDVSDVTHGQLAGWSGGAVSGKSYVAYQCSSMRFDDVQIAQDLQKQVAALNTEGFYIFVPSEATEPDPSLGDSGQYASQATTGKLWVKESGLWSFLGIYKGFGFKGAWSSATAYTINDVVTLAGSSYIATATNTNQKPPNAGWTVLAGKGADGGAVTLQYAFNTSVSGGIAALGTSPQNAVTVIDVSDTDLLGANVAALLASLGTGTSAAKQYLRVYKQTDQTKFLTFKVTSVVTGVGYHALVVVNTASSGANPFTAGDAIVLAFSAVGDKGDTGNAATIAVGTVTTGIPGSSAAVINSGTSGAAVFDITIPRGSPGAGDMSSINYASEYSGHEAEVRANLKVGVANGRLAAATDFNTVQLTGTYYTSSSNCTNTPIADRYWHLEVLAPSPASFILQRATSYEVASPITFIRTLVSGTWGAWLLQAQTKSAATKSANYTAVSSDIGRTILLNGTFTLSFDAVVTLTDKWACSVKNIGSGIVTFDPNGSELIDGSTTIAFLPGQSCEVTCDGAALYTLRLQSEIITKLTASAQASLVIPLPAGYASHEIDIHSLLPATTAAQLHMQISTDGGVSYISAAMGYNWSVTDSNATPVTTSVGSNYADTKIQLTGTQRVSTASPISGRIELHNASSTSYNKRVMWKLGYSDGSSIVNRIEGLGEIPTVAPITHIKLFHPSSVNISTAAVTLRSKV